MGTKSFLTGFFLGFFAAALLAGFIFFYLWRVSSTAKTGVQAFNLLKRLFRLCGRRRRPKPADEEAPPFPLADLPPAHRIPANRVDTGWKALNTGLDMYRSRQNGRPGDEETAHLPPARGIPEYGVDLGVKAVEASRSAYRSHKQQKADGAPPGVALPPKAHHRGAGLPTGLNPFTGEPEVPVLQGIPLPREDVARKPAEPSPYTPVTWKTITNKESARRVPLQRSESAHPERSESVTRQPLQRAESASSARLLNDEVAKKKGVFSNVVYPRPSLEKERSASRGGRGSLERQVEPERI